MKKALGILSGVGAAAGCRLAELIVQYSQAQGAARDSDFPPFVLYNLPAHNSDKTGVRAPKAFVKELAFGLRKLDACGCDYAVIACNTAHLYFNQLANTFSGVLLNVVQIGCAGLSMFESVGVLCSRTSRDAKLFASELARQNTRCVSTNEAEQAVLDEAIEAAICGRISRFQARAEAVVESLAERGAEAVLLGCTELPLVIRRERLAIPCFDPAWITVKKALSLL